jgi:hypothetical protein
LSTGLLGGVISSKASRRVGPLYQGMLVDFSIILSPLNPEMGMNLTISVLYPIFFKKEITSVLISLYLSYP